ncbi:hypothetical protein A2U01_0101978, partial [Trifolium medium]|nr:hypothetical protein [Trifolium medium]
MGLGVTASAEEVWNFFCHLRFAQERTARRARQLDSWIKKFVQGRVAQLHLARRVSSSVLG